MCDYVQGDWRQSDEMKSDEIVRDGDGDGDGDVETLL